MRFIFTFLILFSFSISGFSETTIFSGLGIGDLRGRDVQNIAVFDSLLINGANFSLLPGIKRTIFSLDVEYSMHKLNSTGKNSNYDHFNVRSLAFALPFGNNNIFALDYTPYTMTDVTVIGDKQKVPGYNLEDIYKRDMVEKTGLINNVSLAYGKRIANVSFSVGPSMRFGNVSHVSSVEITNNSNNSSFDYNYQRQTDRINITSFDAHLGTFVDFGNFGMGFSFVAPYAQKVDLVLKREKVNLYGDVVEVRNDTTINLNSAKLPSEFYGGASYRFNKSLLLGLDLSYSNSSTISDMTNVDSKLFDQNNFSYRNKFSTSLGIEYCPSKKYYEVYYKRINYKLRFSYLQQPFKVKDSNVDTYALQLGIDLPYNRGKSIASCWFSVLSTGDKKETIYSDLTYRLAFKFVSSNSWWLSKEEY